jgi:hypothetical protein
MVSGHLRVAGNGLASLDLDAPLPRDDPRGRIAIAFEPALPEDVIVGVLGGRNQHVRLSRLTKNGGNFAVAAPSHEAVLARRCLVGAKPFAAGVDPSYATLICPMAGYEDWLSLQSIDIEHSADAIRATYTPPPERIWSMGDRALRLSYGLSGAKSEKSASLRWSESAELSLTGLPSDIEAQIELAAKFEDLFILLTDSERGLDFPSLQGEATGRVQLYFARNERSQAPVDWSDSWVAFPRIADDLGRLLEAWLAAHEQFGPGFHLYLGNRRGMSTYPEFRFASFIWGLESMHRVLHPLKPNPRLADKVARILKAIERTKDRVWAEVKLPTSEEPPLQNRLFDLLSGLPIGLDRAQVVAFAQRCTQRRNEVSHFGGARDGQGYDEFLDDVIALNRALDLLYHARILQQIGLDPDATWWWFIEGYRSHFQRSALAAAGLDLPPAGTVSPFK